MKLLLLTLVAFIAVPAPAQIMTRCQQLGQFTNCQTDGSLGAQGPIDYGRYLNQKSPATAIDEGLAAGQALRLQRQQIEANRVESEQRRAHNEANARKLIAEIQQNEDTKALRKRVGVLVGRGDCAGAVNMALEEGDFRLADIARQFCAKP